MKYVKSRKKEKVGMKRRHEEVTGILKKKSGKKVTRKKWFKTSHGLGIKGLDMAILVVALKMQAVDEQRKYYLCIR